MGTNSDDFILLGDDMGKDPESYAEVQKNFPTRILAAYIHVVNARSLPKGMQPYWTTFDLFLREHLQGRMSASWLTVAFEKLLNETRMNFIFPKKAQCPTDAVVWEWQTQTVFTVQAQQLIQKFNQHCQQRQSGKILL